MIRLLSDIHLEFGPLNLPVMEDEDQQILVLAGDVGIASKGSTFLPHLEEWSERFQDIIYVLGNHEHYHGSILRSIEKIKREISHNGGMHNVHVVNNEIVRIHNISFVCSTMWASYNNGNPHTMYDAGLWMNDHKAIRTGTRADPYQKRFRPEDAFEEFIDAINFIFPAIKEEKVKGQNVCVVTHHGPSLQSVHHPRYKEGQFAALNGAYCSDLEDDIIDAGPDVWVHGHVHDSFDYRVEGTRVVCNPRGYFSVEENPNFDPRLVIELND